MIINKTIIVFRGDILITPAIGLETGRGKIILNEMEEPVKIGTQMKDILVDKLPNPIEFIFEDEKSIDVLIKSLETCKENMINFKKENNNEK